MASASLSDAWDAKGNADNYTGFFIGPMVDITIPIIGLGVDGALMYSQKGTKILLMMIWVEKDVQAAGY